MSGLHKDTTGGCTHFDASRNSFSKYEEPGKLEYKTKIGNHYFFEEKWPILNEEIH